MEAEGASSHCPHLEQVYDHLGKGGKNCSTCAYKIGVRGGESEGVPHSSEGEGEKVRVYHTLVRERGRK